MPKTGKQLYAELQALKDELPRREIIAALLDAEGFNLAVSEYKEKFKEAVDAEDKKEISICKKHWIYLSISAAFCINNRNVLKKFPN